MGMPRTPRQLKHLPREVTSLTARLSRSKEERILLHQLTQQLQQLIRQSLSARKSRWNGERNLQQRVTSKVTTSPKQLLQVQISHCPNPSQSRQTLNEA